MRTSRRSCRLSLAERLLWLEDRNDRISRMLHEFTALRVTYQEEARRLRVSLTAQDRALYDALESMRMQ